MSIHRSTDRTTGGNHKTVSGAASGQITEAAEIEASANVSGIRACNVPNIGNIAANERVSRGAAGDAFDIRKPARSGRCRRGAIDCDGCRVGGIIQGVAPSRPVHCATHTGAVAEDKNIRHRAAGKIFDCGVVKRAADIARVAGREIPSVGAVGADQRVAGRAAGHGFHAAEGPADSICRTDLNVHGNGRAEAGVIESVAATAAIHVAANGTSYSKRECIGSRAAREIFDR